MSRAKIGIFVILGLVLGEFFLRVLYTPPEFNPKYDWNPILWMHKYVYLNSAGYRDREFSSYPPSDTYRIYVVGNSYTYGWGINNIEDTYPKVIERELAKTTGRKIEVINAGQPGFHLGEDVYRFESEGKQFHPNLVVVGLNFNDANINNAYYYPADNMLPGFIRSLRLYHFFIGQFLEALADKNNYNYYLSIYNNPHSPDWQKTEKLLLELQTEADTIHAQVALLLFPHIDIKHPNAPYTFYPYHERYKDFAKKHGMLFVDPLSLYKQYPHKEDLVLNPVDEHPSVTMDHMAADAFVKQFDTARLVNATGSNRVPLHTQTITIDKENRTLGNYSLIDAISSKNLLPWVYFDAPSSDRENFFFKDTSSKQTFIYYDRLSVLKDQPTEILYNFYPAFPGTLVIPKTLYGYRVIGFKSFKGIAFATGITSPIIPSSVVEHQDNFIITYQPKKDVYVVQTEALIAVNKMEISPDTHQITSITTVETRKEAIPEETQSLVITSDNRIASIPQIQKSNRIKSALKNLIVTLHQITNLNIFSLTDYSGKVKPQAQKLLTLPALQSTTSYAFVDGVLLPVRVEQKNEHSVTLYFDHVVKKGQIVKFSFLTNDPLQDGDTFDVTTEEK